MAATLLWIGERLFGERPRTAEEDARRQQEWLDALANPDWDGFERIYKLPVPGPLRRLYAQAASGGMSNVLVRDPQSADEWEIGDVQPLWAETLEIEWTDVPPGSLPFATTLGGDPYYWIPGATEDGDGPVYFVSYDGEATRLVAPSLSLFLQWPRATFAGEQAAAPDATRG